MCSDFIASQSIANTLRDGENGAKELWIEEEVDLPRAQALLQEYLAEPEAERISEAVKDGQRFKKEQEKAAKRTTTVLDARTTIFYRPTAFSRGVVTLALVVMCVAVGVFTRLGGDFTSLRPFLITGSEALPDGNYAWIPLMESLRSGELWRLFTPMLIHFGLMHIVFNMMWLLDLGSMIEQQKGRLFLLLFLAVIAGASNLAQYFVSGPMFGGMSGVNYGLIGYIWMKGRYDPGSGLDLHKSTITMMVIWYLLCLVGVIPHVANTVHTVGFAGGIAWGFLTSLKFRQILTRLFHRSR